MIILVFPFSAAAMQCIAFRPTCVKYSVGFVTMAIPVSLTLNTVIGLEIMFDFAYKEPSLSKISLFIGTCRFSY